MSLKSPLTTFKVAFAGAPQPSNTSAMLIKMAWVNGLLSIEAFWWKTNFKFFSIRDFKPVIYPLLAGFRQN